MTAPVSTFETLNKYIPLFMSEVFISVISELVNCRLRISFPVISYRFAFASAFRFVLIKREFAAGFGYVITSLSVESTVGTEVAEPDRVHNSVPLVPSFAEKQSVGPIRLNVAGADAPAPGLISATITVP